MDILLLMLIESGPWRVKRGGTGGVWEKKGRRNDWHAQLN